MTKISNILFLISLVVLSVGTTEVEQAGVGLYPSLLQFAIPTTRMNCSYISCLLNLFNQGYSEISTLNSVGCIKGIFDSKVSQLNNILKNGQCINDTVPVTPPAPPAPVVPTAPIRDGDNYIWAIDNNQAAWFRNPTGQWAKSTTQQFGSNIAYYLDRYPTIDGGYNWMIGVSSGPWWIVGANTYWNRPSGFKWNFLYIRVSPFDKSVWAITTDHQLQYAVNKDTAFGGLSNPSAAPRVRYLDVSPKDGSGYVIGSDYRVFFTPSPTSGSWTEITGLAILNLRVISNGYIFAIATDNKAYYKTANTAAWTVLDGQDSFTFLDINNRGRIYAIRKDHSTWTREYVTGTWSDTGKTMETVRVLDDGSCVGIGYNELGGGMGNIWLRNGTSGSPSTWGWTKLDNNNGFNGASSLWGPSNHKFYWSENNVYFDETTNA